MKVEYKTLIELGSVSRGKSRHRPRNDARLYGGMYPFVQTSEVKSAGLYIKSYSQTYNDVGLGQSKLWDTNTLCITIAANIADTAILSFPACFPDSIIGFIPYEGVSDVRYIKYCFDILQSSFKSISQGATQDNLSLEKLLTIKFPVLPIETQCRIADILSAYNSLIENNQMQIKLHQEAVMRLYIEWFVKLRYPGYETMKILDGVPEGWEKKSINDLMTFHRGYDLTKNNMRGGSYPVLGSTSIIGYHNEFKIKGPGIVTGRSGSLGTYQLIWDDFWPHNTSLFISDYKEHDVFFLYCLLQTVDFTSLNTGGAIPTLNRNSLSNIIVLEPRKELQERFALIAKKYYERTLIANKQIILLREARDKLLPRLMSGEIEV